MLIIYHIYFTYTPPQVLMSSQKVCVDLGIRGNSNDELSMLQILNEWRRKAGSRGLENALRGSRRTDVFLSPPKVGLGGGVSGEQ